MADITEQLIAYLDADPEVGQYHVGEVVPAQFDDPYVWLMKTGTTEAEGLDFCGEDEIGYDVECVARDIEAARTLTDSVKKRLRDMPQFDPAFDNEVQFFLVSDHADDYIIKSAPADVRLQSGNLSVIAYL